MSMGLPAYTSIGTGTWDYADSHQPVFFYPNANTLAGDLVVGVIGAIGAYDMTVTKDAGDGWVKLAAGANPTDGYGMLLVACIASKNGANGYAGMILPGSTYHASQCHTFRIDPPAGFLLGAFGHDDQWVYNTASATALDAPSISQPYQQVIDLVGRACYNAGVATSVGNITNFTERFDVSTTTGRMNLVLNDRTAVITGAVQNPSVTSNLAAAKTYRMGVRAMIPIIGNTSPHPGRYGRWRRLS
jgi:hypothetical protein